MTSQSRITRSQIQEKAQEPMRGRFLSQQQTGKKQGLCRCEIRYSQEFRGSSSESMSMLTHSISTLMLSLEHWLSQNFYHRMPFKATQYLFLISVISSGSNYALSNSLLRTAPPRRWFEGSSRFRSRLGNQLDLDAISKPASDFSAELQPLARIQFASSTIPACSSTFFQFALLMCLFFFMSASSAFSSYSHSHMNFLKNRIFASLLTHTPIFLITQLHVGALMTSVRKAHPEVFSRLTIRNLGFSYPCEARISVKAIPTAPRRPPQVKPITSLHLSPYPSACSFGMNTAMDKKRQKFMQTYSNSSLKILSELSTETNSDLSPWTPTIAPPRIKIVDSAMKMQVFQKFQTISAACGAILVLPNAAMYSPSATKAMIPLIFIPRSTYSATKYTRQDDATVIFRVRTGSFFTFWISFADANPKTTPSMMAPRVSSMKSRATCSGGGLLPLTSSRLMVNRIMQVPSLSRLQPSIKELNLRGAPAYLSNASTATVSVQESTEPNMKASGRVQQESSQPMMNLMESMTSRALTSTEGNARMNICTDCLRKMYQSELKELSKMRGGRKISRIPWGSISDICLMDSPMMPVLSQVMPSSRLTTNRVGVQGTQAYTLCSLRIATARVSPKKKNRSTRASGLMNPQIITRSNYNKYHRILSQFEAAHFLRGRTFNDASLSLQTRVWQTLSLFWQSREQQATFLHSHSVSMVVFLWQQSHLPHLSLNTYSSPTPCSITRYSSSSSPMSLTFICRFSSRLPMHRTLPMQDPVMATTSVEMYSYSLSMEQLATHTLTKSRGSMFLSSLILTTTSSRVSRLSRMPLQLHFLSSDFLSLLKSMSLTIQLDSSRYLTSSCLGATIFVISDLEFRMLLTSSWNVFWLIFTTSPVCLQVLQPLLSLKLSLRSSSCPCASLVSRSLMLQFYIDNIISLSRSMNPK